MAQAFLETNGPRQRMFTFFHIDETGAVSECHLTIQRATMVSQNPAKTAIAGDHGKTSETNKKPD